MTKLLIAMAALVAITLTGVGCSSKGTDEAKGSTSSPISGAAKDDDEEEVNDKIYCSVNTDCDSDETCVAGKCTGNDGDVDG